MDETTTVERAPQAVQAPDTDMLFQRTGLACLYRKLKSDHSGDEVRPEWRVNE